jgi:hypothetical protein
MKRTRLVRKGTKKKMHRLPSFINTVAGKAYFVKTETEDKHGKWNDDYSTRDGYWVLHSGKKHHVYKVR